MFCQVAFSGAMLERLIRYRVADQFRPLSVPVDYPQNDKSWLDGFMVTQVAFNRVVHDQIVVLNDVGPDGTVHPVPGALGFWSSAVTVDIQARAYFARVQDVAAAGLNQPPVQTALIPIGILHLTLRVTAGNDGIPLVSMELDTSRLAALQLPPTAITALTAAANLSVPFDVATYLKAVVPGGPAKVLNTAVTMADDGTVVMRFELSEPAQRSVADRANEWLQFCEVDPQADIGEQDWCISVDGSAVAAKMATTISPLIKDSKPLYFDSHSLDWSFADGSPPRVVVKESGRINNACAGNDIRFDAFVNVDLSVPQDDTLRATLGFDFTLNDWDVAKCFGVTLVNGLSLFITLFDQNKAGIGAVALAGNLFIPVQPVAVIAALGLLIAGVDHDLAQQLLDDQLKNKPTIVKSGDDYLIDQKLSLVNELTRDWLVLKEATGAGGRFLLRGLAGIPQAVLPRVQPTDLEGFSAWQWRDYCNPGKGEQSSASLQLALVAGYYDAQQPSPPKPTIPLKYGISPDGTTLTYQVLSRAPAPPHTRKGPPDVYEETLGNRYQPIDFSIPGSLNAVVTSDVVSLPRYAGFAAHPYPLRIRFFTNGGVREYEFPPPPAYQRRIETTSEAAQRISQCMALSVNLVERALLRLRWLVDPERGDPEADIAQHWTIHLRGLQPGREATAQNEHGAELARFYANAAGRAEISIILPGNSRTGEIHIGLGDALSVAGPEHSPTTTDLSRPASPAKVDVVMRQSLLFELDHFEFDDPVHAIGFGGTPQRLLLQASTEGGRSDDRLITEPRLIELAARGTGPGAAYQSRIEPNGAVTSRGNQRTFTLTDDSAGRSDVLADYVSRSALDASAFKGALFAQASEDGRRVILYRLGQPKLVSGFQRITQSANTSE
jgi:hypothetical protein